MLVVRRRDSGSIPLVAVRRDGREIDRIVAALPPAVLEVRLAPVPA
jgi:hypothetical protein